MADTSLVLDDPNTPFTPYPCRVTVVRTNGSDGKAYEFIESRPWCTIGSHHECDIRLPSTSSDAPIYALLKLAPKGVVIQATSPVDHIDVLRLNKSISHNQTVLLSDEDAFVLSSRKFRVSFDLPPARPPTPSATLRSSAALPPTTTGRPTAPVRRATTTTPARNTRSKRRRSSLVIDAASETFVTVTSDPNNVLTQLAPSTNPIVKSPPPSPPQSDADTEPEAKFKPQPKSSDPPAPTPAKTPKSAKQKKTTATPKRSTIMARLAAGEPAHGSPRHPKSQTASSSADPKTPPARKSSSQKAPASPSLVKSASSPAPASKTPRVTRAKSGPSSPTKAPTTPAAQRKKLAFVGGDNTKTPRAKDDVKTPGPEDDAKTPKAKDDVKTPKTKSTPVMLPPPVRILDDESSSDPKNSLDNLSAQERRKLIFDRLSHGLPATPRRGEQLYPDKEKQKALLSARRKPKVKVSPLKDREVRKSVLSPRNAVSSPRHTTPKKLADDKGDPKTPKSQKKDVAIIDLEARLAEVSIHTPAPKAKETSKEEVAVQKQDEEKPDSEEQGANAENVKPVESDATEMDVEPLQNEAPEDKEQEVISSADRSVEESLPKAIEPETEAVQEDVTTVADAALSTEAESSKDETIQEQSPRDLPVENIEPSANAPTDESPMAEEEVQMDVGTPGAGDSEKNVEMDAVTEAKTTAHEATEAQAVPESGMGQKPFSDLVEDVATEYVEEDEDPVAEEQDSMDTTPAVVEVDSQEPTEKSVDEVPASQVDTEGTVVIEQNVVPLEPEQVSSKIDEAERHAESILESNTPVVDDTDIFAPVSVAQKCAFIEANLRQDSQLPEVESTTFQEAQVEPTEPVSSDKQQKQAETDQAREGEQIFEASPRAELQASVEVDPEAEAEPEADPEVEAVSEAPLETSPETGINTDSEVATEAMLEAEPNAYPEFNLGTVSGSVLEVESETDANAEMETKETSIPAEIHTDEENTEMSEAQVDSAVVAQVEGEIVTDIGTKDVETLTTADEQDSEEASEEIPSVASPVAEVTPKSRRSSLLASTPLGLAAVNEPELMEDKRSSGMFSRLLNEEMKLSAVDGGDENNGDMDDLAPDAEYAQPFRNMQLADDDATDEDYAPGDEKTEELHGIDPVQLAAEVEALLAESQAVGQGAGDSDVAEATFIDHEEDGDDDSDRHSREHLDTSSPAIRRASIPELAKFAGSSPSQQAKLPHEEEAVDNTAEVVNDSQDSVMSTAPVEEEPVDAQDTDGVELAEDNSAASKADVMEVVDNQASQVTDASQTVEESDSSMEDEAAVVPQDDHSEPSAIETEEAGVDTAQNDEEMERETTVETAVESADSTVSAAQNEVKSAGDGEDTDETEVGVDDAGMEDGAADDDDDDQAETLESKEVPSQMLEKELEVKEVVPEANDSEQLDTEDKKVIDSQETESMPIESSMSETPSSDVPDSQEDSMAVDSTPTKSKEAGGDSRTREELDHMNVKQLRALLKDGHLPTYGKKVELIDRLLSVDDSSPSTPQAESKANAEKESQTEEEVAVKQEAAVETMQEEDGEEIVEAESINTLPPASELAKMKVKDLQALLKERNMSVDGTRKEMVGRLLQESIAIINSVPSTPTPVKTPRSTRKPTMSVTRRSARLSRRFTQDDDDESAHMNDMKEDGRAAARAIEDADEDDNNGEGTGGPVEFGARKELFKLTVRELRAKFAEYGAEEPPLKVKKEAIVEQLLNLQLQSEVVDADDEIIEDDDDEVQEIEQKQEDDEEQEVDGEIKEHLQQLTVPELRKKLEGHDEKLPARIKKDELIDKLMALSISDDTSPRSQPDNHEDKEVHMKPISQMNIRELSERLKEEGLSTVGSKTVLINRLQGFVDEGRKTRTASSASASASQRRRSTRR